MTELQQFLKMLDHAGIGTGKRKGQADARDLWPEMFRLIRACRPAVIFGEQVAGADVVGTELETAFVTAVQRGDFAKANRCAERIAKREDGQPLEKLDPRWIDRVRADLGTVTDVHKIPGYPGYVKLDIRGVPTRAVGREIAAGRLPGTSVELAPELDDPKDPSKKIPGPILGSGTV